MSTFVAQACGGELAAKLFELVVPVEDAQLVQAEPDPTPHLVTERHLSKHPGRLPGSGLC
jgi:hypothetical protein